MKPFNKEKAKENNVEIGEWFFHGDVVIQRVETLPDNFNLLEKTKQNELALGEAHGHVHQLSGDFDLRIDSKTPSKRHLKVVSPVSLRHQEHEEITIPIGDYVTYIQREYCPFEKKIREVAD